MNYTKHYRNCPKEKGSFVAYQVLQMATVNGAKAIGREGELGILQEGALADIILVNFENPHLYPHTNLI